MAILEVEHIEKHFENTKVLKDVGFSLEEGNALAIIGSSGSGKTTLLRCLNFLETPDKGKIIVRGETLFDAEQNSTRRERDLRKKRLHFGMVFQSYAVWPHMTVAENVGYPLKIQKVDKKEREERVQKMLELVHLGEYSKRYPHQLSGGQQQRVALARALVAQPGLLLLDEPLSNLDAKLRESMRFEILAIQKELGITVVYVTHDQGEAMAMSDRVVVMSAGVVQQIGAPHEIYTKPANKMVADFIGLVNFIDGEVKGDRVFIKGSSVSFPNIAKVTGEATIAVRPENITMSLSGGQMEGQVTHRFYLGDAVDYRVNVHGHDIRVIVKGADLDAIPDGSKVYLDFDRVMVFDRN